MSNISPIPKHPRSPPLPIPKSKRRNRNVYNSFFPEPRRTNKLIKMDLIQIKKNKIILKKELEIYKKELEIFTNLQNGEKLGKEQKLEQSDGKKYYKQLPYNGLWLSRWWYSEGRDKTIDYLDEDFSKFMNYLDRIIDYLNTDLSGVFVLLVNNIREFINSIITGLYNLKQTYSEYVKMVAKVDSIILTLLDFKEKTDDYLSKHKQNVRLTIKSKSKPIPTNVPEIYNNMPSNSV